MADNILEQAKLLLKHIQENPGSELQKKEPSILEQAQGLLKYVASNPDSLKKSEIRHAVMEKWEPRSDLAKASVFNFGTGKSMAGSPKPSMPKAPAGAPAAPAVSAKPMAPKPSMPQAPVAKAAPAEGSRGIWYSPGSLANKGNSIAQKHMQHGLKEGDVVNMRGIGPHRVAVSGGTGSGARHWMVPHTAAAPAVAPHAAAPKAPATVHQQPRAGVRPSALKTPIVKAAEMETPMKSEMEKMGPSESNWGKEDCRKAAMAEWKPRYHQKGVHQPISEGSGRSAAGALATGAKPGSKDSSRAKEEHEKVIAEQKGMKKSDELEKGRAEQTAAMKHPDKLGAGAKRRKHLSSGDKASTVMREFYHDTLHSGSGKKVTDPAQAKAIAVSEAGKAKK